MARKLGQEDTALHAENAEARVKTGIAPTAEPRKLAGAGDEPRFDAAATAAAVAVLLTSLSIGVHPWVPSPSWADALVNQALILFAASYVILAVATAISERFTRRPRHPLSR